jgi:hypothetical protein
MDARSLHLNLACLMLLKQAANGQQTLSGHTYIAMKILFYLCTFVFGFLGVATACRAIELALLGDEMPKMNIFLGFIFLLLALASWHRVRDYSEDEVMSSANPTNQETITSDQNNANEHQSVSAFMAKAAVRLFIPAALLLDRIVSTAIPIMAAGAWNHSVTLGPWYLNRRRQPFWQRERLC